MARATVSRRRACRQCGGRYFVSTVTFLPAVIALVLAGGGVAKAVFGSGFVDVVASGFAPAPESFPQNAGWGLGAIVLAGVVLLIAHGYRCIGCDTRR
jgi:hypothetical protein